MVALCGDYPLVTPLSSRSVCDRPNPLENRVHEHIHTVRFHPSMALSRNDIYRRSPSTAPYTRGPQAQAIKRDYIAMREREAAILEEADWIGRTGLPEEIERAFRPGRCIFSV